MTYFLQPPKPSWELGNRETHERTMILIKSSNAHVYNRTFHRKCLIIHFSPFTPWDNRGMSVFRVHFNLHYNSINDNELIDDCTTVEGLID